MFLMLYSINWPNFIVLLPLLLEILGSMCVEIAGFPGCDVIKFETNFFKIKLSYQAVFLHDQKGQEENLNTLRM